MLRQASRPGSPHKLSPSQLKNALQKIKSTQLEVIKMLRSEEGAASGADIRGLQQQINQNMAKVTQSKQNSQEKRVFEERMEVLNRQVRVLENEIQAKNRAEDHWRDMIHQLEQQVNSFKAQLGKEKNRSLALQQMIHTLESEKSELFDQRQSLKSQLQFASQQVSQLEALQQDLHQTQETLRILQCEKDKVEEKSVLLKDQVMELERVVRSSQAKAEEDQKQSLQLMLSQVNEIKQQKETLQYSLSEHKSTLLAKEREITLISSQLKKLQIQNHQLASQNQDLKDQISQADKALGEAKLEKSDYQMNINKRYELFEKMIEEKAYLMQQIKRLDQQSKERGAQFVKQQKHFEGLEATVRILRNEAQREGRVREEQRKGHQFEVEKLHRQARSLRETAYHYQMLKADYDQLKRKTMKVDGAVVHLWEIKEAEYDNIQKILKEAIHDN